MRRPVGLILAQIALAFLAFFQLCCLLGTVAAFTIPQPATPSPLPHGLLTGLMIAFGLFFAALATWSILTIVGLARLRSWARYSILVIGGLLAAFGALLSVGSLVTRVMVPTLPQQPGQTPQSMAMMSYVFIGFAAFYAVVAAVGVWWLVYFNLRATRALFEPQPLLDPGYPAPPPPPPGRFDHIPVPILVLSILYAISAVSCAIMACFHLPAFLMGFILTGASVHVLYASLALLSGAIGYGLFRLDNRARVAGLVQAAVGTVNIVLSMLPYYQAHLRLYSEQVNAAMSLPLHATASNPMTGYPFTIFIGCFGIAVVGTFAWILIHYRPAFKTA
jgi:hypothetical protein